MTPIKSIYDLRLLTLVGVAMMAIEELALEINKNPEQLLSDYLYLTTKRIHEKGEQPYMDRLQSSYALLEEAIS